MEIENHEIVIINKIVKIVKLAGEGYEYINDPVNFIKIIKSSQDIKANIFTFCENIPVSIPKYDYYMEWDNFAAVPVDTYNNWWAKQINDKTRNLVRKSVKKGVVVRKVDFNEKFVHGIVNIYNETPFRQGKLFLHYKKDFNVVKKDNSSYSDRSYFIGAYFDEELIGFMKLVINNNTANIMQILSMVKHRDKSATNALIDFAVKICEDRNIKYLIYAKYTYGNKGKDPLSDFKIHNGFLKYNYPRYYVPLNSYGKVLIELNLHKNIKEFIPEIVLRQMISMRYKYYNYKYRKLS